MRATRRQLLVAAGVLGVLLVAASPAGSSVAQALAPIAVSVTDPGRVARRDWPLQIHVPFPRGALHDASEIGVSGPSGAALPVQVRVLASWPDGSVRWALIDTQADLDPERQTRLRVQVTKSGSKSRRAAAATGRASLRVVEKNEFFEVDTGVLRFRVPRRRFAILENVQVGDTVLRSGMTASIREGDETLAARRPRLVRVVEQGPLRALLELEGDYGNGIDYSVRLETYAGQPFVRIWHRFANKRAGAGVTLARIGVEWPVALGAGTGYVLGVDGAPPRRGALPAEGLRVYQPDNLEYRVGAAPQEGRLEGWWDLHGQGVAVGLAVRWFWQEYPQAVTLSSDRLAYDMWAAEAPPARVGMGAAKTHEFLVWVTPAGEGAKELGAAGLRAPVTAVDPGWIAATRALPGAIAPGALETSFLGRATAGFADYLERNAKERWDDRGEVRCPSAGEERPRVGAFGMWNWGDWNFPGYHDDTKGCDAWGNLEYDTTQVLALLFAATGRWDVHDEMVAAARHFMDVDTIHFNDRHPEWVGMNHPKNPLHFSFALGGVDLGHTWTEGLVSTYYLTGDGRALAAARGIADYLARRSRSVTLTGNPRQWGWPQIALMAVYDATHDDRYRAAALEYARRGMRAYRPTGLDHWKLGILADGLAYTHAAAGGKEIEDWLRNYARAVAGEPGRDPRFYPAVAYVAALENDDTLRLAALEAARRLRPGAWGKPFTLGGRIGFRIYSALQPAGRSAQTAPAPRGAVRSSTLR